MQSFLKQLGLNDVTVQNFFVANGHVLSASTSEKIEEAHKKNSKQQSIPINLFNPKGLKIKEQLEALETIGQTEALPYINQVIHFRIHYKISYDAWDHQLKSVYVAIAKSDDWDRETQCLVLGLLSEIYVIAYIRSKVSIQDLEKIQMILRGLLKADADVKMFYKGWGNTIVCEDRQVNTKWAIVNCMDENTPPYIGISFIPIKIADAHPYQFVEHYQETIIHAGSQQKFLKALDLSRSQMKVVQNVLKQFKRLQENKINAAE